MTTKGNLELRQYGEPPLYASCTTNGQVVFGVLGRLARFIRAGGIPDKKEYRNWFCRTAEELGLTVGELNGESQSREVVIDANRRLVIYNLNSAEEDSIAIDPDERLSIYRELARFNYQVLSFYPGSFRRSPEPEQPEQS